jgi:UDP-N-acetylmuramate--alanine ligase
LSPNFRKIKHLHFVGIGGAGMSGIAEVLHNLGYVVSGSDVRPSEVTERLENLGIKIFRGHQKENVFGADVLVYSSAIKEDNPEIVWGQENKIPVIRRAEMLGELMRMKFGIGIAGTHGKTTTTSMTGEILTEADLDPTIIVGGKVVNLASHAKVGNGDYLVAEADEFDRSFLTLTPTIAVVTTLEAEHLDCYADLDDIKSTFVEYMNKVPFYGSVIICLDEKNLQELMPQIKKPLVTYGLSPQADLIGNSLFFFESRSQFRVFYKGNELGEITLQVPGIHNVKNALAAIAVGIELEIPWSKIEKALSYFKGVVRRFEIKGVVNQIMIVDDYAHHPTEIQATLKAARTGWKKKIVAVFQPHLFSRTRDFAQDFGKSFFDADILIITDVYPAREEPIPGVRGEIIAQKAKEFGHKNVHYVQNKEEVPRFLVNILKGNELVITMGAGDVNKIGVQLLTLLKG